MNGAREIECGIEQRAPRRHHALSNSDPVQCCTRVDAESDGQIDRVPPSEAPRRERERLFNGLGGLAGTSDQKDPESLDSESLDSLRDFPNFGCVESLLEPLQHWVAGALRCNAQRSEAGRLHRGQQLCACGCRCEIGGVEMNAQLAPRDCLTHLNRMAGRRVESRIDKVEVVYACLDLELFDLVGNQLRIAGSVSPAFHVSIRAVDALVDAAALGLNG